MAPPVQFVEKENKRTLSGKVFEDGTIIMNGTRYGDGIMNGSETSKGIDGVTVRLYEADKYSLDTSSRGGQDVAGAGLSKTYTKATGESGEKAEELTSGGGEFRFEGFIPDDYIIEFTWGDGNHQVISWKGTTFITNPNHSVENYWYKDTRCKPNERASDAYDNWNRRLDIDYEVRQQKWDIETVVNNMKNEKMYSYSDVFKVPVEYDDIKQDGNYSSDYKKEFTTNEKGNLKYDIKNIDFGITERPKQGISLSKYVHHIKVTLLSGQVLVDTDVIATKDASGNVTYSLPGERSKMTALPGSTGGGYREGQIKLEVDNELIQGATLEIEYAIDIYNKGEKDYKDPNYYKLGPNNSTPSADKLVRIELDRLHDYTDSEWGHAIGIDEWSEMELDALRNAATPEDGQIEPSIRNSKEFKDRIILYSKYLSDPSRAIAPGETAKLPLKTQKVLTTARNGEELTNEVEVTLLSKPLSFGNVITDNNDDLTIPGNYEPGTWTPGGEDDDGMSETFTTTPNTGANLEFVLPVMIGIASFAILAGGITFIKKKILDK